MFSTLISDFSDIYSIDSKINYLLEAQIIAEKIFMEYFNSNAPFKIYLEPRIQENLFFKFGITNITD